MERIFATGMREFMKLRERRVGDVGALLDGARRAMRASFQREMDTIESNLSFLASVGSVSPYVGLFGTVWGIMHAFVGLAGLGLQHARGQLCERGGLGLGSVHTQAQTFIRANDDLDHMLGALRGLAHRGQVDHAGGDERCADHEDDQQHQHHIDERHHVHLGHGAAAALASGGDGGHGGGWC